MFKFVGWMYEYYCFDPYTGVEKLVSCRTEDDPREYMEDHEILRLSRCYEYVP